jgi:ABC-type transport system involved in multi-copper enzyme maturation permease subunit
MSSVPQPSTEKQKITPLPRRESVVMGRQDYISVLLRLTGAELYKIRRRLMSKVLSTIAICTILIGLLFTGLATIIATSEPASTYLPPACSSVTDPTQPCLDHTPTQADLQEAASIKQENLRTVSNPLRLPGSFTTASQITEGIGLVLIIILAGTIVGGEYGAGTIRVLYTRGPTRGQFLLAKALCLLICIVLGGVILVLLGILMGALLNLITGLPMDFSFFTINWLLHAAAYFGIVMLGLLMYALLALCLSTLGRATAAGLTGALVWWGLEGILGNVFVLLGNNLTKGLTSTILKAIPDYFIGNNINALLANQSHYLNGGDAGTISNLQAITVLAAYVIVFFGSSWLVNWRRDITN